MSKDKGIFEPEEDFAAPAKSPFSVEPSISKRFAAASENLKSPFAEVEEDEAANPFAPSPSKSPFGFEAPEPSAPSAFAEKPVEKEEAPFGEAQPQAKSVAADLRKEITPAPVAPAPAPVAAASAGTGDSDSFSIRQLALRAIFGVDRELSESEILERAGALTGIRHLARVSAADLAAVEGMKRVLENLNFGGGEVKLYSGDAPIHFVREGAVTLAVQTEGGFGPGVRETLMIAARELGQM
jgi:hypothetical protein